MTAKEEIKMALIKRNMTLSQLIQELNKKYNRNDSVQNLSNKLRKNTIKYYEVKEIAEILNITIEWKLN